MELSVKNSSARRSIVQQDSVPEESLHAYLESCDLDAFTEAFDEYGIDSLADVLDDNVISTFELQRDIGMTSEQAARIKNKREVHSSSLPQTLGLNIDGSQGDARGSDGDKSMPELELSFSHVPAGRLALLAQAMAAHEPSAGSKLLDALDTGLRVLRVGADGATHSTLLAMSADRQSLKYSFAAHAYGSELKDRTTSSNDGRSNEPSADVSLPLDRLAAVVDLAPPADGLKSLKSGVAALSEERRAAVAQVVAKTHPSAAKQALLLCFLEPEQGGSSGTSSSTAATAAEMLAANPAYSAAVSMLELAAHAAVLRHPPNSPRGTLNTAVAALAQTPYSPRAAGNSAAEKAAASPSSPLHSSPASSTHEPGLSPGLLSANTAASAAKCAKLFRGGAVVGNGLRALVLITNGMKAKQVVLNGFQALLDQCPPNNPQSAGEENAAANGTSGLLGSSSGEGGVKAATWKCLQMVHRVYRPPEMPPSNDDGNGDANLRRCRVGALVHVPYHSSLRVVVEWPPFDHNSATSTEDEETATTASERAWRASRSQSNANPLINPSLSGSRSTSSAAAPSADTTSPYVRGGALMRARVCVPNAVFGSGTFVRAVVVAVHHPERGEGVSSSLPSTSPTSKPDHNPAGMNDNSSGTYTLAYFDGPFVEGDEPPVPTPRVVKEALQRSRRSAVAKRGRLPLAIACCGDNQSSSSSSSTRDGHRKLGGLSREQWNQLKLFRLPAQPDAAFSLIGVKRHLFEVNSARDGADPVAWPVFIVAASIVQGAAFVYYMYAVAQRWPSMHQPVAGPDAWWFMVVGSFDDSCPDLRPEWWRLWSYQLVHVGWMHITANLSVQLLFGIPINMMHGNVKTALLYELSVVGSALSFVALGAGQRSLVGCSGGVYSLLGAHMSEILFCCHHADPQGARGEGWKTRLCRGCLLVAAAVAIAYLSTGSSEDDSSHNEVSSAWQAHVGGFIVGLLGGGLLFRWSLEQSPDYDNTSPRSSLNDRVSTLLTVFLFVLFFGATLWETYNTDGAFPPEGLFSALEPASESCCSQVLACNGLGTVDYFNLMCDGVSDIRAPSGKVLDTCAEIGDYPAPQ